MSRNLTFVALLAAVSAHATGGAFFTTTDAGVITSHSIIVASSQTEQTIWDSMTVSGAPTSFAWVLPIRGTPTVGLSSDALFRSLEASTSVVTEPPSGCGGPPRCEVIADAGTSPDGGLTIVAAHATLGPYQTAILDTQSDPTALSDWLTANGFSIPPETQQIISGYVTDGFDFLVLKLVPGAGTTSPRPIRVTTAGATGPVPLRIDAAGASSPLPIQLYVLAPQRVVPSTAQSFAVDRSQLAWNLVSQSSNYDALVAAGFADAGTNSWLVETAAPFDSAAFQTGIVGLATSAPLSSGYADSMGNGATQAATDDMAALFGRFSGTVWLTRFRASLLPSALTSDPSFVAAANPTALPRELAVPCPSCDAGASDAGVDAGAPDASVDGGSTDAGRDAGSNPSGDGGVVDGGGTDAGPPGHAASASGCGCTAGADPAGTALLVALFAVIRSRRRIQQS